MNAKPPPLPFRASEPEPSDLARQMGNACLAAPLILLGLSFALSTTLHNYRDGSARLGLAVVGLFSLAILAMGLLCGVVALVEARRGQRLSVLARVLPGVMLIGLLVALAAPNFVRARNLALRRRQAVAAQAAAAQDFQARGEAYSKSLAAQSAAESTNCGPLPQAKYIEASEVLLMDSEEDLRLKEVTTQVNPWIAAENFDQLESLADHLRQTKLCTASGVWHLALLCRAVADLDEDATEHVWESRGEFCRKWATTRSNSITAQVAWASFMKNYAWHARGYGYAPTVTESGWKLFGSRLKLSENILTQAKRLPAKCPVWWDTMLTVALGEQWSPGVYDTVFNEAVAFEPAYTGYYCNKAKYLLPRWHGKEGDWQRFATASADKLGGDAGDMLYARLGWRMHDSRIYHGFLRDAGYSWPRMRQGLNLIERQYPQSISAASEFAYLLYQSGEFEQARPVFLRLDRMADRNVWGRDKYQFFQARNFMIAARAAALPANNWSAPGPAHLEGALVPQPKPLGNETVAAAPTRQLLLKGISGTPARRLAIINDQTFASGETASVRVDGHSVSVTCLDIKEQSVVIRIGGAGPPTEIGF